MFAAPLVVVQADQAVRPQEVVMDLVLVVHPVVVVQEAVRQLVVLADLQGLGQVLDLQEGSTNCLFLVLSLCESDRC